MRRGSGVDTEPPETARRPLGRVLLALLIAVGGVVVVAVVAGSVGRARSADRGVDVAPAAEALDAMVMALLTVGLALTIAMFLVQFGGEREERRRTSRRRMLGALLVPVLLVGMIWLAQEIGLAFDIDLGDQTAEMPESVVPEGSTDAVDEPSEPDRSDVGSWVGIAFGLLIVGVGSIWMFGERRRLALDAEEQGLADDERDELAGLLDLAIDDLRSDPDPRRAVIGAWNSLGAALASVGLPRDDAEAPFPYLERALDALHTSGPAATRLTAAFESALFSSRPVGRDVQLDAVDALVAVRDELRVHAW